MNDYKIIYGRFRHELGFERDKKYLAYVRQFGEPHHLLGSEGKAKHTDYLVYPVTHTQHELLHGKDGDKAGFFVSKFIPMLKLQHRYYKQRLKGNGNFVIPKVLNLDTMEECIEITKSNIKLITEAK
ncbi:MAG: hypothetical protein GY853_09455 [PVC group bacterium]|nr:hypothetical protein [PVC group bacterium]